MQSPLRNVVILLVAIALVIIQVGCEIQPHLPLHLGAQQTISQPYFVGNLYKLQFFYLSKQNPTYTLMYNSKTPGHLNVKMLAGAVDIISVDEGVIRKNFTAYHTTSVGKRNLQINKVEKTDMFKIVFNPASPFNFALFCVAIFNPPQDSLPFHGYLVDDLNSLDIVGADFSNTWTNVEEYKWDDWFVGKPFWNLPMFSLFVENKLVATTQMWAAEKGMDCLFHNKHPQEFCEIHFTLFNNSQVSGMSWVDEKEQGQWKNNEKFMPLLQGEEHCPFWEYDKKTGKPILNADGSIHYPYHRWISGGNLVNKNLPKQLLTKPLDVWVAFEIYPDFCIIS